MFFKFTKTRTGESTLKFFNKNVELLTKMYNKQYSQDLKKTIELYAESQTILKVSESSYITLFRYDYSKSYILLELIFSMGFNGELIHDSYLDKLPATSNRLNLEILKIMISIE